MHHLPPIRLHVKVPDRTRTGGRTGVIPALLAFVSSTLRASASMQIEILALRHQLGVCQRSVKRPRVRPTDRILWAWLSRIWSGWRDALFIVQPRTVIAWRRPKFREHCTTLTRAGRVGRPTVARKVRDLIRRLSSANPLWGAPRIVGERSKIGIDVATSTVEKDMVRSRKPPSPAWRAFLENHITEIVAHDAATPVAAWFPDLDNVWVFAFATNGNLYFDSGGKLFTMSYRDGRYGAPRKLASGINDGEFNALPFIAPDESYVLFSSARRGSANLDLYVSFRDDDGAWGPPKNLGTRVNTTANERFPSVSPDGKYLFFLRNELEKDADANFYWVDAAVIVQ